MKKSFSFNNQIISPRYHKINSNFSLSKKLSKRQIDFGSPRPVREYKRFLSFRESLTGFDPHFKITNIINKDIIKPMKRPYLYDNYNIKSPNYKHNNLYKTRMNKETKWAIGTVARAPDYDRLPKKQQFKIYNFPPEYNNKDPEEYKNYSLKTDCIGIKIPKINKVNSDKSFLKMKAGYSASNETKVENQWIPYTGELSNINVSSKNYDIINCQPFRTPRNSDCKILNKSSNCRKKGIGEYYDLSYVFNKNFNKEYSKKLAENPKRFYKYNGAFTNMYDASNRNGKITLPFDLKQK